MKTTRAYPRVEVDTASVPAVGQAGGVLLTETVAASGLYRELSAALAPWRKPLAIHDPVKVVLDLAISLALGGDTLSDVALLRAEPQLYGPVASDPTVSRTIDALAADPRAALAAINAARAVARMRAWVVAGREAPDHGISARSPLIIDVDATLVTSHSDKEQAAATFKRGYGFHPLCAFLDHGPEGSGEPLALLLRPGNAGSNTAADHITVLREALKQLPGYRRGTRAARKVLIRTDAAGCTHDVVKWMHGQRLSYSVGFTLPAHTPDLLALIPEEVWTPAYDAHDEIRDGAWVAELTDLLDLSGWPPGMRVIVRKERPHPGAQLRITDIDGHRVTAFATNTRPGGPGSQLADLELRHRRRARCEDRIRTAKDTGLRAFPLHDFAQNQIWLAIVALAAEITAWMQMLALPGHHARRWEPKRLRLRLFTIPATVARSAHAPCSTSPTRRPGPTSPPPASPACASSPPPANHGPLPRRALHDPRTVEPAPTRGETRDTVIPNCKNRLRLPHRRGHRHARPPHESSGLVTLVADECARLSFARLSTNVPRLSLVSSSGVRTPIIGGPRPLSDERRAHDLYTLICEEPAIWRWSP